EGTSLNHGTDNGDGSWTLTADQLADLKVVVADADFGQPSFTLHVTATTVDGTSLPASSDVTDIVVNVNPVAEAPSLVGTVTTATLDEDSSTAITIVATPAQVDPATLSPYTTPFRSEGTSLNHGTDNGDGS